MAMVPVALTFAVLNEGHGTADVGYVLAAETVPLVALLLVGGVVADRFGRRAAMLATGFPGPSGSGGPGRRRG